MIARGFMLVELLVALAIMLLIAGAIAAAAPAARAVFDRVPVELEMQQRGRTALDTLSTALRSADRISVAGLDEDGGYSELTAVIPVANGAQGVVAQDQSTPAASLMLATSPCPNVTTLCGFVAGSVAMIADADHDDVFIVSSVNAVTRFIAPDRALSHTYLAGSTVAEVQQSTFGLDQQPDGTYTFRRITAAGAVQPIVDFISSLVFTVDNDRVDILVTVRAPTEMLRKAITDRTFRTSIRVRNAS